MLNRASKIHPLFAMNALLLVLLLWYSACNPLHPRTTRCHTAAPYPACTFRVEENHISDPTCVRSGLAYSATPGLRSPLQLDVREITMRQTALLILLILTTVAFEPFLRAQSVTISPSAGVTTVVPLQAFSSLSGMTPDSNGKTYDLGYVNPGAYVVFTLSVAEAGNYSVLLNYSQPVGTSAANILIDGSQQASVPLYTTGSWSTYFNTSSVTVSLPAGQVSFEIAAPAEASILEE